MNALCTEYQHCSWHLPCYGTIVMPTKCSLCMSDMSSMLQHFQKCRLLAPVSGVCDLRSSVCNLDACGPLLWKRVPISRVPINNSTTKGSTNIGPFKHFAQTVAELDFAICDISNCELHVAQGVRNAVPDIRLHVGKMFSLSRVYRVASFVHTASSLLEYVCHTSIRRVLAPPAR